MAREVKKQFSMSLLVKILLGLLVVVSIGIFANSLMRVNAIKQETEELEEVMTEMIALREELVEKLGSGEEVEELLRNYEEYEKLLESDPESGELLDELNMRRQELQEMINSSKYKEQIVKIARERLGLYFSDEIIIYHDKK